METIYEYSRAQAIEDGVLVDISAVAAEAGFKFPVAITAAAWEDCVAWTAADTKRKGWPQDEAGRLWDVVYMARIAARRATERSDRSLFQLLRVPRAGRGTRPRLVTLKAICGPGDDAEPVITIMLPNED